MYRVLNNGYESAGSFTEINKRGETVRVEYFRSIMTPKNVPLVRDMAEAKRLYGGAPILEWVRAEEVV